jgi:hypothetical protein
MIQRIVAVSTLMCFIVASVFSGPLPAQADILPAAGARVPLSAAFTPAHLRGLVIDARNPFKLDFIVDKGDTSLTETEKRAQYTALVKYFLAALTVPDTDQWVNLSPVEKDRIIADNFGATGMGRDLLGRVNK